VTEADGAAAPLGQHFVPICAIGASAGGVVALQNLFRQLPADLGFAYVVILHLSPDLPSALSEILSACTRMSVHQVQDSPKLKRDCVYVIPPDRELVIEGDNVSARPFKEPRGQRAPIDVLYRSIAAARGDGVAMVLSGAGADGSVGVRAIKEAGGVVFVQEPAEADFAPMPQNAIATGAADFVGPVAALADRLADVARSKEAVRSLDLDGAANDLRRIVGFLRTRTGHDFSGYKRATVMRRVARRMQVCRAESIAAYAEYLMATPEEAKELFADLLISVTQFFRDHRSFEALQRHAVKGIFDDIETLGEDGIRAWVVGCATGEEAYSVAILLLEEAERRKVQVPIQLFATDLDEGALATAREGRYPKSIEGDVSEERLARFFVDEGAHYRVRKEVRETVLFALHSVLKEPPFMRLDLISCRNLLIYLERSLQQQVCAVFHYGLKSARFLFLGSAETADTAADLFAPLDRESRIYAAKPSASHTLPILPQFPTPERLQLARPAASAFEPPSAQPGAAHAKALEQSAPPSALVDAGQNIHHLSETAGRFILHAAGPMSRQLTAVVRPELRLDLKLALARALDQRQPTITPPVVVSFEGERRRVSVHVAPAPTEGRFDAQALVFFLDSGPVAEDEFDAEMDAHPEEVRRLHAELKAVQEALVASRSGHDATIEDLRAANEELQSTNEEYRSTAEELETSREELQSINEELRTLNAELKSKFEGLSTAHSDLQNLTAATEIGTLFLDGELRIKMFTPPIADLFNITQADLGREVTDFTHRLDYPALVDDARQVLHQLAPVEREVRSSTGLWYVVRIRPYRTIENRIDGVVLTFVDITHRQEAETALSRSEQQFRALVEATAPIVYRMSPAWDEMRELIGGGLLSDSQGSNPVWLDRYVPAEDQPAVLSVIDTAVRSKSVFNLEHRVVRLDGTVGWVQSRAVPLLDEAGEIIEWFGAAADVTARHRAEEALRDSEERLRVLIEGVPQLLWRADDRGSWTWSSPQWTQFAGLSEAESRDRGWLTAVHPADRKAAEAAWLAARENEQFEVECRIRNAETSNYRWFQGRATPRVDTQGNFVEWLGTFTDVHDLRALQEHQRVLLSELQHRVRNLLAVIRAIAARTAANSEAVEDFASHLEGRLASLARTQVILTRSPGGSVDLESMVREELLAQAAQEAQVDIDGPTVELSAKAAEFLSLAIHELATNALKYGALAKPDGRIKIRWKTRRRDKLEWLTFHWTESGVSVATASPRRSGFGTELIELRIPYELKGEGQLSLVPGGMRCEITFPMAPARSILATDSATDGPR